MDQIVITPAGLMDILSQIDELAELNISVSESESGLQITVGDSTYSVSQSDATPVEVTEDVIDEVDEINVDAYEDLESSGSVELSDVVEGGPIKELLKTLAVGGLVRLTKHLLTK